MSSPPFPTECRGLVLDAASRVLHTMQIITAAIAAGALLFLLVVFSIPRFRPTWRLPTIAAGFHRGGGHLWFAWPRHWSCRAGSWIG